LCNQISCHTILVGPLVILGKAYPAYHAPGEEIPGELTLVAVARHQHHNSPIVNVLKVDGGCGPQIAREGFSVVSSITSWPIHASGIFPSESEALGLSLSIIAPSPFSVPLICKGRRK
jgi:hypothetical protein